MSDLQKNIIEKILKEQKKTKRELAVFLDIKENSINRTLKNPNIAVSKLEKIAQFLDIDIRELLFEKSIVAESKNEFENINPKEKEMQIAIGNLSEALNRSTKTIENLVKIITDNNLTGSESVINQQ
jgi:transcriptional regulator with XRE-family HTH domain